ncbi:helix-turn-helix domain-containing protein [Halobacteria archaeon AArc-dxtr1]|nr:helix-turn-helix domain-containing protein [Halobacteria archaeon AArc-dxtr1]
MKSLRASITFSEDVLHPAHELLCTSPTLHRQVIYGGHATDGVEAVLSYVEGDPEPYRRALEAELDVEAYELTPAADGFYLYERRTLDDRGVRLAEALSHETVVLVPPIEFRADRTVHLTLVGHPQDLQATVDAVPDGMTVDVLEIGAAVGTTAGGPTDRQREALAAAWEVGYYDVPRREGIESVAESLDCAVSTASELLRRAESRLVARALDTGR